MRQGGHLGTPQNLALKGLVKTVWGRKLLEAPWRPLEAPWRPLGPGP